LWEIKKLALYCDQPVYNDSKNKTAGQWPDDDEAEPLPWVRK